MHTAAVKRLPVVERGGRLVGIVSRVDLLKVFDRSDADIRREIIEDVIVGAFMMAPSRFFLHVNDGVVRVENRLVYDLDDQDANRLMTYPWIRA